MKPAHMTTKRRTLAYSLVLGLSSTSPLYADLFWDGSTTGSGGGLSDNWNTTDANWAASSGGGASQAWTAGETAILEGAGGTITLTENVALAGITAVDSFTLVGNGGGEKPIFSGSPIVNVAAGKELILDDGFDSESGDFIKTGDGTVTFRAVGINMNGNKVIVDGGTLNMSQGTWGQAYGPFAGNTEIVVNSGGTLVNTGPHGITDYKARNTVTLDGGTYTLNRENYHGAIRMTAGTINGPSEMRSGGWSSLNVTSNAAATSSTISARVNLNGANGTFNVADGAANQDLVISGAIGGNANSNIILNGAGTVSATGANTYQGTTTVNDTATLIMSGTNSTSAVLVTTNATLAGAGTIAGDLNLNGTLDGGFTVGTNSNLAAGSVWQVDLTANGVNEVLDTTGTLDAAGMIGINLGYTASSGDSFDIADFAEFTDSGYSFDFSNASLDSGLSWDTSSFATDGTITVVPEPSSVILLGLGSLGLIVRRRRS